MALFWAVRNGLVISSVRANEADVKRMSRMLNRPFFGTATNKNMHTRVYGILLGGVMAGTNTREEISEWMEWRGHGDLCRCPECGTVAFGHSDGCVLNRQFTEMFASHAWNKATEAIQSANAVNPQPVESPEGSANT